MMPFNLQSGRLTDKRERCARTESRLIYTTIANNNKRESTYLQSTDCLVPKFSIMYIMHLSIYCGGVWTAA